MPKPISNPRGALRVADFAGGWLLHELPASGAHPTFLWIPFKLSNPTLALERGRLRTFSLTWNPLDARLAKNRHAARLAAEQPTLHTAVLLTLELRYDRAWLTQTVGVTDSEVEAEVERLAAARRARKQRNRGAPAPSL